MDTYITELGACKDGFWCRKMYLPRDEKFTHELKKTIEQYDNTNVFYCVYNYENSDVEHCNIYGPLYIDLDLNTDTVEGFEKVKGQAKMVLQYLQIHMKLPVEMIRIYFSGNKGFHIIVPPECLGIVPTIRLNEYYKKIVQYIAQMTNADTIDTKIYDRKRLFRMPNSKHGETGLYKVPLAPQMLWDCSLAELRQWAEKPRRQNFAQPSYICSAGEFYKKVVLFMQKSEKPKENKPIVIPKKHVELPPCVKELLVSGAAKGTRNDSAVLLTSSLIQKGYNKNEVYELLEQWNENNDPPIAQRELATTIASAYNMIRNGKAFGCTRYKDLGYCDADACKINEAQQKTGTNG